MNILVTGGAGFIGSHTIIELYKAGHRAVVVDNLSNSNPIALKRVAEISGVDEIPFHKVDIRDREGLEQVFVEHQFDACIHVAGLKAVGESVEKPWEYYENNIAGTLTLVDVMRKHSCKNIIFSSSATVYGDPAEMPITENCPKGQCTNPYGWTKSMLEQVLMDIQKADPDWNVHYSGGSGQTQRAGCVWQRLSDARRHRCARLYTCMRPRQRSCGRFKSHRA